MADSLSEQRGQTVRETWVTWAKQQPAPKPSWLVPWDDLDDGQREVDMLIGDAVAAAERERCAALADIWEATYPVDCHASWCAGNGKHGVHRLPLGAMIRELGDEPAPCESAHVLHLGGSPDANIIDGAMAGAVAAEQERIRTAAREAAFTLFRPGNGPAQGQSMEVVPLGELLAILGEESTDGS